MTTIKLVIYFVKVSSRIFKLIEHKILFYKPSDSAFHLNLVYNDIDKWWNSESLQQFRNVFVNKHALTSENLCLNPENVFCK